MSLKGFTRNFKPLEMLSEENIATIHRATLEVLWLTGIRVEHDDALKLFKKNGCKIDHDEKRVHFPPSLVEECLRKCPSSFTLKARHPKDTVNIGGNTLYFTQSVGQSYVDVGKWELRPGTLQEHGNSCRLCDALENLHLLCGYEFCMDMVGVPECMMMLEGFASGIRNSSKVQVGGTLGRAEIFSVQLAEAAGTDFIHDLCVSPPLTIYKEQCDQIFTVAGAGFPLQPTSGAVYGATAPVTLAGAATTNNAEVIAATVLAQLVKPGVGIQVATFCFPMNMRSGAPVFGGVEHVLHQVLFEQYWRWLGIPTASGAGFNVSSKKIDYQNGYERALSVLTSALAGDNRIYLQGAVSQEMSYNDVQAVLDDDMAGWIGRLIEGIEVSNETLPIDLINEVGPIPGVYLDKKHTRDWWHKSQYMPKVADRLTYQEWQDSDRKDCLDLAGERVKEILTSHKPIPLSPSQENDVVRILQEAREFYRKNGQIADDEWKTYLETVK